MYRRIKKNFLFVAVLAMTVSAFAGNDGLGFHQVVHFQGSLPRQQSTYDEASAANYDNCQQMGIDWLTANQVYLDMDVSKVIAPDKGPMPDIIAVKGILFNHTPLVSFLGIEKTYGYLADSGNSGGVLVSVTLANRKIYRLAYVIMTSHQKNTGYSASMRLLDENGNACDIPLVEKQ